VHPHRALVGALTYSESASSMLGGQRDTESAKEALYEIREMHKAWKEKLALEAGIVEGELSEEGG